MDLLLTYQLIIAEVVIYYKQAYTKGVGWKGVELPKEKEVGPRKGIGVEYVQEKVNYIKGKKINKLNKIYIKGKVLYQLEKNELDNYVKKGNDGKWNDKRVDDTKWCGEKSGGSGRCGRIK